MKKIFEHIEAVVADIRKGKMVIVVDDANRENEGDVVLAGQYVTPQAINFMVKHARGLVCMPTRRSGCSNWASSGWCGKTGRRLKRIFR